jgi:hypothetical protein|tara:strand:- start:1806 stop:2471 length:666 start_codon:yes stop_codon:yes gene_type:complete
MIISIHQPNFCPYFGFFNKVINSDVFVILDDVQIEYGVANRNKIITRNGSWERIKVPINKKYKFTLINEAQIDNEYDWGNVILEQLSVYNESTYFKKYEKFLNDTFKLSWDSLYELNMHLINKILKSQGINTKIVKSSDLDVKTDGSQRVVDICEKLGADKYYSGGGAKKYLDIELFKNIKLEWQELNELRYEQVHSNSWIPKLSILDMMFNVDSIIDYIK